jgi:hypothetical protein
MSSKTQENRNITLFIQRLDKLIALGLWRSPKGIMLKRDKLLPTVDEPRNSLLRTEENDRVFPLDTVELQKFKTKHDIDVSEASIHTGPYADELARSMNALAVTLGCDVFFRNGAYSTATEGGRAVLSHELTHIGQYKDQRLTGGASVEELENEAEFEEQKEYGVSDPVVPIMVGGKIYRVRKSETGLVAELGARKVKRWLREKELLTEEDEYLRLLVSARDYRGQRE